MNPFDTILKAHMSSMNQASSLISSMHADFVALAKQYLASGSVNNTPVEMEPDALDSMEASENENELSTAKGFGLMNDWESHYPWDELSVPESKFYTEDGIDLNDSSFYSGKSMGLPKNVSIWGTPRGRPDTMIPLPSLGPKVGMPLQLSINFTNRGPAVDQLLSSDSGMYVEGENKGLGK